MKEVTFKEIAHLYLGCQVQVLDIDGQVFVDTLQSVIKDKSGHKFSIYEFGDCPFDNHSEYYQDIKPILRRLDSLTEDEATQLFSIVDERVNFDCVVTDHFNADDSLASKDIRGNDLDLCLNVGNDFSLMYYTDKDNEPVPVLRRIKYQHVYDYLLKQGFDLYNLIPRGLAIDAESLKTV